MNDLHGETAEVHRWNYYSYKAWDAEYFVNERVPHEAIWLNKLNIPSDFFSNIAEDKSCIPFLEMISEMFGNKGYPLDQNVLDKIKKFEKEMILSNKIKKFKGIDKKEC